MLIFQGLDDRVVPPSQLDAMVAAFTARGLPHVAMTFEGEGHGFRRAETRRAAYRAELAFLGAGLRVHAGRRHRADGDPGAGLTPAARPLGRTECRPRPGGTLAGPAPKSPSTGDP